MSQRLRFRCVWALLAATLALSAACQNGTSTETIAAAATTGHLEDVRIGRRLHAKTVLAFGGEIRNPKVHAYVDRVGKRLIRTSGIHGVEYTFTVLNSDIVNAFSLPGGYVYVTRALVALVDNEAQLAAVLAHEVGHVTARHAVQRVRRETAVGIATGAAIPVIGELLSRAIRAGTGADIWLRRYSREQELEADKLAVLYLSRARYDVNGLAAVLRKLQAQSRLEALLAGRRNAASRYNALSTHPRAAARVRIAVAAAGRRPGRGSPPRVGRADLLDAINEMDIDGDRRNGFIRKGRFIHPVLGLQFDAPEGFRLLNQPRRVIGVGPSGTLMQVDGVRVQPDVEAVDYLTRSWGRRAALQRVQTLIVNGMPAATAVTGARLNGRRVILRLLVIKYQPLRFYRFVFLSPAKLARRFDPIYRRAAMSFRKIGPAEAARARPLRLRIATVRKRDTIQSLAARMAYDRYRLQRFIVLNGLSRARPLRPGSKVKLITD